MQLTWYMEFKKEKRRRSNNTTKKLSGAGKGKKVKGEVGREKKRMQPQEKSTAD